MAMRISPITAQLGRLSIGGAAPSSSSTSSSRTGATRLVHTVKRKKGERVEPSFEPGHGEKIFIFNHFRDGMTVYSHDPIIKPNQAFQQIPFNGKKLRPAKIRKDYWRPMAMIQFPEGQGEVGRSVYQRLRECKKLHEYSWGDEVLYGEKGQTLTTRQRGRRLNNQRANTIADMAAVLGGLGKGNKIVIEGAPAPASAPTPASTPAPVTIEGEAESESDTKPASGETGGEKEAVAQEPLPVTVDNGKALVKATVWWADANDKNYAERWTSNVTHELFEEAILVPKDEVVPEVAPLASQAAAAEVVESTAPPPPPPPPPNTA